MKKSSFYLMLLTALLFGCKTQKTNQTTTRDSVMVSRQSVYQTKFDSVLVVKHDSIYIERNGDTLLVERWHTQYVSKLHTDTVKTGDTVYVNKNINQVTREILEVDKPLNWWQRFIQMFGYVGLGLCLLLVGYTAFKLYRTFKK